jgi:hypothetical protein
MQKVILELRLLTMAARRAAAARAARNMEARLTARLEAQERAIAEMQRSAGEALAILRGQLSVLREHSTKPELAEADGGLNGRVAAIEQTLDAIKRHTHEFEHSVAADLVDLEESMQKHNAAMEEARTRIAQTDDVVERVVKALEALQRAVTDRNESGDSAVVVN